jgi:hypothetical protein
MQHVAHAEQGADPGNAVVAFPECERGRAADHVDGPDLRQLVEYFLRDSVAEELVLRIGTDVGERQDGNRILELRTRVGLRRLSRWRDLTFTRDMTHTFDDTVGDCGSDGGKRSEDHVVGARQREGTVV